MLVVIQRTAAALDIGRPRIEISGVSSVLGGRDSGCALGGGLLPVSMFLGRRAS